MPRTARGPRSRGTASLWPASVLWLLIACGAAPAAPLYVAVVSDLNGSYGSTRYDAEVEGAVARIVELRPDLVISTGDMVAGQRRPHLERREVEAMWASFHADVTEPLRKAGIPFAVTPGNHDASFYRGFELERRIYDEQWSPRRPGIRFVDDADYPFHYAIAVDDVLFVSLDATVVGDIPARQMDWLRNLLDTHGARFRYRVAFSHLPLWPFAHGRAREIIGDTDLHGLLEGAEVDLFLSGHHHAFYPGSKDGIAFVGQACLGAGPRRLLGTGERAPQAFTLLRFGDDRIEIGAYTAPSFDAPLDWRTLPARIESRAATLVRADLAGTAAPLQGHGRDLDTAAGVLPK